MDSKKEATKKNDSSVSSTKTYNQQAANKKSDSASQGRSDKSNADTKDYAQKDKKNLKGSCCD